MDKIVEKENLEDTFVYLDDITIAGRTKEEHDRNVKRFLEVVKRRQITLNHQKTVSSTTELCVLGYKISEGLIRPDPERMRPLEEMPPPKTKKGSSSSSGYVCILCKVDTQVLRRSL